VLLSDNYQCFTAMCCKSVDHVIRVRKNVAKDSRKLQKKIKWREYIN